jgi:DNA-binding CsgD family transcriptional regulator
MRRRAEATDLILDARAIAESLGSRPLTERAIELLADARGHARPEEPWAPLTHREYEVARLVVTGSTNAEIGIELSITTKTVASHIEHILNKLGVSRRAEIAAWTARIGDAEPTHASR